MEGLRRCRAVDSGIWPRYRYVEATEDLEPGHIVCRAPALVVTVSEEWTRRVCASCFAVAEARLEVCCSACKQCYYCDAACCERHTVTHSVVCPALKHFTVLKRVGKETMAVLRMLLEVLALEHGSGASRHEDAAFTFDELQHHPLSFDTPKEATDWTKCCSSFRTLVESCEWCPWRRHGGPSTLPPPPTEEALHALVSRIDSNCFGVFRPGCGDAAPRLAMGRNVDLLGRGLYLQASMFNHSCVPNCSVSAGATTLEVVTDEAVRAGQELCISYIDLQQPVSARQKLLSRHYHFACACERCSGERTPGGAKAAGAKLSYHSSSHGGPKKLPPTKREKRDRREQRAATNSATGAQRCDGEDAHALPGAAGSGVEVRVELRVLLKLQAKAPPPASRKPKGAKPPAASAQLQAPVCCVRLYCQRRASPMVVQQAGEQAGGDDVTAPVPCSVLIE